jgi:prevent-host-death family protein
VEISKSQLKSKLLEVLREVESENTEVIVTDRGKPVAKISKFQSQPTTEELFKDWRGRIQYFEDLTAPTTEEWGNEI